MSSGPRFWIQAPRARGVLEYADYVVEIVKWEWDYSLSVGDPRYQREVYSDHRHLEIRGRVLGPEGIAVERAEIILMPHINLAKPRSDDERPTAVGSIDVRDGVLRGLLVMADDALAPVLQALIAGRLRYVDMRGECMRRREALGLGYRMTGTREEERHRDAG